MCLQLLVAEKVPIESCVLIRLVASDSCRHEFLGALDLLDFCSCVVAMFPKPLNLSLGSGLTSITSYGELGGAGRSMNSERYATYPHMCIVNYECKSTNIYESLRNLRIYIIMV